MKVKFLKLWDKYFFHMFFFFVALLLISSLYVFIGKPDVACTEIPDKLKPFADVDDRVKKCFNIWEMDELKAYNEYLSVKYPPPKAEENYFLDRINPNSSIDWLND